jgi:hypothetical protein
MILLLEIRSTVLPICLFANTILPIHSLEKFIRKDPTFALWFNKFTSGESLAMRAQFAFEYQITEPLAERVAEYIVRTFQKDLTPSYLTLAGKLLLCVLMCAAVALLGEFWEMSEFLVLIPWTFAGLIFILFALMSFLQLVATTAQAIARMRIRRTFLGKSNDGLPRVVSWEFTNEDFTTRLSDACEPRQTPWNQVARFRMDTEFWILGIKDGPDLVLPVEFLNQELRDFIAMKVKPFAESFPLK